MSKHILIAAIGSFGDLHPYLAIAIGLKQRGHHVTLASMAMYREKIEGEGLRFVEIPPDLSDLEHDPVKRRRAMATFDGTRYVIQELFLPSVEAAYRILLNEARSADLLLGSAFAFGLPLVAARLNLPYIHSVLQPAASPSRFDPPLIPAVPFLVHLPPWLANIMYMGMDRMGSSLLKQVYQLAAAEGLPPSAVPKLFGHCSPHGNLMLFSKHFAAEQPDYPKPTTMCGFPFYDKLDGAMVGLDERLESFLGAGEPPCVFTLGTSAVLDPGNFYLEAQKAIVRLKRRAVFLVGRTNYEEFLALGNEHIHIAAYAPHSLLMARGAVTIHQGGIGTTAQALRAGKPMVVVPFSHDQPDNARRCSRLGVGFVVPRKRFKAALLEQALTATPVLVERARAMGSLIQSEDAVAVACDRIEATQPSPRKI